MLTALAGQGEGATAAPLRYTPRSDCFYAGEDPLWLARQIPGLVWPSLEERDPRPTLEDLDMFSCRIGFRAAAVARRADLEHLFRYVLEEVEVWSLEAAALAPPADPALREGEGAAMADALLEAAADRDWPGVSDLLGRLPDAPAWERMGPWPAAFAAMEDADAPARLVAPPAAPGTPDPDERPSPPSRPEQVERHEDGAAPEAQLLDAQIAALIPAEGEPPEAWRAPRRGRRSASPARKRRRAGGAGPARGAEPDRPVDGPCGRAGRGEERAALSCAPGGARTG